MTIWITSSCSPSSSADRGQLRWVAAALLAACGAAPPAPPEPPARRAPLELAAGAWTWSRESMDGGVRRVERERWELARDGDRLGGVVWREVVFESVDGLPFTCNQDRRYRLQSAFDLAAALPAESGEADLVLTETGFEVVPSPCEPGARALGRYRARLVEGGLLVEGGGDRRLLRRAAAATGPPPPLAPSRPGLDGRWRWRSHEPPEPGGERRSEREVWTLAEDDNGLVSGTYERTMTVTAPDGKTFPCNGESSYQVRDRYHVRGTRTGDRVSLLEVEVELERDPSPCVPHRERHLETARGEIYPDELVLTWPGRVRQVLRRE